MKIDTRGIGPDHPPFIIAEMSGNHNQSLDRALAIVEAAAQASAHGLKIQTYTADTMTLDLAEGEFFIADPNSLWAGASLYQLYQQAHTPWEWHQPIFARARERGWRIIRLNQYLRLPWNVIFLRSRYQIVESHPMFKRRTQFNSKRKIRSAHHLSVVYRRPL